MGLKSLVRVVEDVLSRGVEPGSVPGTMTVPSSLLEELRDAVVECKDDFASVVWRPADVTTLRPGMSDDEARDFLASNEGLLQELMVGRGWDALEVLLGEACEEEEGGDAGAASSF